jgi:MFS family permease
MAPRNQAESILDEWGSHHRSPGKIRMAGFFHILMVLVLALGIPAMGALIVWYDFYDWRVLWFLAAILVLVVIRAIFGTRAHCCICHQPLFLHRPIGKSRLAPRLEPLGPHSSAALLSLVAKSIRCPYCGRVNRLAKD